MEVDQGTTSPAMSTEAADEEAGPAAEAAAATAGPPATVDAKPGTDLGQPPETQAADTLADQVPGRWLWFYVLMRSWPRPQLGPWRQVLAGGMTDPSPRQAPLSLTIPLVCRGLQLRRRLRCQQGVLLARGVCPKRMVKSHRELR